MLLPLGLRPPPLNPAGGATPLPKHPNRIKLDVSVSMWSPIFATLAAQRPSNIDFIIRAANFPLQKVKNSRRIRGKQSRIRGVAYGLASYPIYMYDTSEIDDYILIYVQHKHIVFKHAHCITVTHINEMYRLITILSSDSKTGSTSD